MKFTFRTSPNYHQPSSTKRIMAELTLGLLVLSLCSVAFNYVNNGSAYATKAVMMLLTAMVSAIIVEVLWAFMLKKNVQEYLASSFPIVTAMIFTLMCPIGTPLYVIAVGTIFALVFGKLIFGGFGHNVFNPAGIGRAILFAAFSGQCVPYLTKMVDGSAVVDKGAGVILDAITMVTPTTYMAQKFNWLVSDPVLGERLLDKFGGLGNLFMGFYQGALGETFAWLIILIGIVLVIRKVIDWRVPVFFVGTVFVLATIIGLMNGTGMWYPVFHVLTGGLLFGAVFMATDPVTNPTNPSGRIIYAIGCGVITVLIRIKANLPEGVLYSILLMNMFSPLIDNVMNGNQIKNLKKTVMKLVGFAVISTACVVLAASVVEPKDPRVFIETGSNEMLQVRSNIIGREVNGNTVSYTVWADGYYSSNDKEKEPNILKVTVDEAAKVVVGVEFVAFNDTKNIGDKAMNPVYLAQFAGMSLKKAEPVEILEDVVTGATATSKSVARAVREVLMMYSNEVNIVSDDGVEVKAEVTYDSYYIAFDQKHKGEDESHPNTVQFTFDKVSGALLGWEVVSWGDSSGMDRFAQRAIINPYVASGATLDTVFMDDAVSSATYTQTATSTAVKAAMLEIAKKR